MYEESAMSVFRASNVSMLRAVECCSGKTYWGLYGCNAWGPPLCQSMVQALHHVL